MKTTKYFTLRKAIGVAAAGKLALGASAVSAQTDFSNCGFGKGGEECEPQENEIPPLFLQEFGSPMRILTPPGNDFNWDHIGYDPVGDDSGKGGGSDMIDPNMEPNMDPQMRQSDPGPDGGPMCPGESRPALVCLDDSAPTCPDGSPLPAEGPCPDGKPVCPDGSIPLLICPDGSIVDSPDGSQDGGPDGGPDGGKNSEDSIDPMDPEAGILWAGAVQRLLRCNGEEIKPPPEGPTRQDNGDKLGTSDPDGSGDLSDEELPQDLRCPPAEEGPPPRPRMEFMIEGVRNDRVMAVILAYSTKRPPNVEENRGKWQGVLGGPIRNGQMDLDLDTLQVVAGIRVDPEGMALGANPPTPLGKIPPMRTRSIKIPVDLSALNDPSLMHNHLFFQAIAVPLDPAGGFIMPESQASEVDHFVIERPDFNNLKGDCGSKGCDDDMHGGFKPDENSMMPPMCPDGDKPALVCPPDNSAPTCPDSSPLPAEGPCPDGKPICPDGSIPQLMCLDGTTMDFPDGSQDDSQTCPDGSPVDASGKCT